MTPEKDPIVPPFHFLGCLILGLLLALLLVDYAQGQTLKAEDVPEQVGEYCQVCNDGTCGTQSCPNTEGSQIITMESIQGDVPGLCLFTSKGWGYFKWEGTLRDGINKFIPCDPPVYILATPTPKGKTK